MSADAGRTRAPVRWGLLSTAQVNGAILHAARGEAAGSAVVVAVGSRDPARARAYADGWQIPRGHGSYEALVSDPEVDAVYVSTPNGRHVEDALRAVGEGKHVLVEKPFGRRPGEVAEVVAAAERAGVVLAEGFMYRHHPQTRRLVELVRDGAVGRLREIRARFEFPLDRPGDHRWLRALDGGALMDLGSYCVHAARTVAGEEPVEAAGRLEPGGDEVDAAFAGRLRFPSGLEAKFDCSLVGGPAHRLEVAGEGGALVVADPWHCWAPGIELRRDGAVEGIAVAPASHYALELADMARAIRTGARPLVDGRDALGQAHALAALYRSAEEEGGRPVPVG